MNKAHRKRGALVLFAALFALALLAAPAQANRALISKAMLHTVPFPPPGSPPVPPPEGEIEAACGLALGSADKLYVSDYYHQVVDLFSRGGFYQDQQIKVNPLDGACGLAADSLGNLYANEYHGGVSRLLPTPLSFEEGESTGIALDSAHNLYVNDRTYVAVYEPSGAPVLRAGLPLKIGLGALNDAYGLAVFGGLVYVADAKEDVIEVYEPAGDPLNPVRTIAGTETPKGQFVSLHDAALAIDPTNGDLLVADNTQPGFAHPKAAIYEFDSTGAFLGQLPGAPIDGEPSAIAVAGDGTLYVSSGNDEEANVFEYSPYSDSGFDAGPAPESGQGPQSAATASPSPAAQSSPLNARAPAHLPRPSKGKGGGETELVQKGPIRVAVSGGLAPDHLPREGTAPITVTIGGQISSTDPDVPPQLQRVSFAFNRAGHLQTAGLPRCHLSDIDPSNTRQALEACRRSLVGEGRFSANVLLPEQSPFPSAGKVLAFYGTLKGKPVIFGHIYGTEPVPTSVVMPLYIRQGKGTFGTHLDASLAGLTGDWGYVTGISLKLGRKFTFHGERRSFLSAGCPAPKGFPGALFALAKTTFSFLGGRNLTATMTRSCTVRG